MLLTNEGLTAMTGEERKCGGGGWSCKQNRGGGGEKYSLFYKHFKEQIKLTKELLIETCTMQRDNTENSKQLFPEKEFSVYKHF